MNKILLFFILKYKCDWDSVYNALEQREHVDKQCANEVEKKIECDYVTIIDDDYPEYLKRVLKPSFVVFYTGDLTIIRERIVAIDGDLTTNDRLLLNSDEMKRVGKYLFDGETISDGTLEYLINDRVEFAAVFKDINSPRAKQVIALLKSKSKNKWVVFSEKYFPKCVANYRKQDYFRMIFPTDETVVFSELSQNKDIEQKINFCKKENLKMLKFGNHVVGGTDSDEIQPIYKPEDVKFFVSYKN